MKIFGCGYVYMYMYIHVLREREDVKCFFYSEVVQGGGSPEYLSSSSGFTKTRVSVFVYSLYMSLLKILKKNEFNFIFFLKCSFLST